MDHAVHELSILCKRFRNQKQLPPAIEVPKIGTQNNLFSFRKHTAKLTIAHEQLKTFGKERAKKR